MAEHEQGESRTISAFLLGFLTGVLVCIGAGGALFFVQGRRVALEAREAEMRALVAREAAEAMRHRAEMEARVAQEAERKAKQEKARADEELRKRQEGKD